MILTENWETKGKFPPRLRPILVNVALKAIELEEYDEDFFAILPKLFPYNLFTMKKLVKRELAPVRLANLTRQQEDHFSVIKQGVLENLDSQKEEFELSKREWAAKVQKLAEEKELATPEIAAEDAAVASALGLGGDKPVDGEGAEGKKEDESEREFFSLFIFVSLLLSVLIHIVI